MDRELQIEFALELYNAGFWLIVTSDKKPVKGFIDFHNKRYNWDFIKEALEKEYIGLVGIAIICGKSEGEYYPYCIDIDNPDRYEDEAIKEKVKKTFNGIKLHGFASNYIELTAGNGFHLWFQSSRKLSSSNQYKNTHGIEILGVGKYALIYPSDNYKIFDRSFKTALPNWELRDISDFTDEYGLIVKDYEEVSRAIDASTTDEVKSLDLAEDAEIKDWHEFFINSMTLACRNGTGRNNELARLLHVAYTKGISVKTAIKSISYLFNKSELSKDDSLSGFSRREASNVLRSIYENCKKEFGEKSVLKQFKDERNNKENDLYGGFYNRSTSVHGADSGSNGSNFNNSNRSGSNSENSGVDKGKVIVEKEKKWWEIPEKFANEYLKYKISIWILEDGIYYEWNKKKKVWDCIVAPSRSLEADNYDLLHVKMRKFAIGKGAFGVRKSHINEAIEHIKTYRGVRCKDNANVYFITAVNGEELGESFGGDSELDIEDEIERVCFVAEITAQPEWIALDNGVVNPRTGEFRAYDYTIFAKYRSKARYDIEVMKKPCTDLCKGFKAHLSCMFGEEDKEQQEMLLRADAYSLVYGNPFQKIFEMVGPTRSGKGVHSRIMKAILGEHEFGMRDVDIQRLGKDQFGASGLEGLRVMHFEEIGDARNGRFDNALSNAVGFIKTMIGGGEVGVERKGRDRVYQRIGASVWLVGNEPLQVRDVSGGFRSKIVTFKTVRSLEASEQDDKLVERIIETELSEILALLLHYVSSVLRDGVGGLVTAPGAASEAASEFEVYMDPIMAFIEQCCVVDSELEVNKDVLFAEYSRWARLNDIYAGSKIGFYIKFFADPKRVGRFKEVKRREGTGRNRKILGLTIDKDWDSSNEFLDETLNKNGHSNSHLNARSNRDLFDI